MQEGKVERGAVSVKLVVLIVLVLVLVAGGIVFKQFRDRAAHRPEAAGRIFVSAIIDKDGGTSYQMFSDTAKKKLTADDWNRWVVFTFDKYQGGEPKMVKKDSVPDPGHAYSKDNSVIRLRYEFPFNEKTYQYDVILVHGGDNWKVAEVGGLQ